MYRIILLIIFLLNFPLHAEIIKISRNGFGTNSIKQALLFKYRTNQAVMAINVKDTNSDDLDTFTISNLGKAENNTDITNVRLWLDDGSMTNQWDNSDTFVSELLSLNSKKWQATGLAFTMNPLGVDFIVTVDVPPGANSYYTFQSIIPSNGIICPSGGSNTAILSNGLIQVIAPRSVHNINQDKWYTNINPANSNANSGNTIEVYPGFYRENVVVKTDMTIQAWDWYYNGSNRTTIVDGGGGFPSECFKVSGLKTVHIIGFQVQWGGFGGSGMILYENGADGNIFNNVFFSNVNFGIQIIDASPVIKYNLFTNTGGTIEIVNSSAAVIISNRMIKNWGGLNIMSLNGPDLKIVNNDILYNNSSGIYIFNGSSNISGISNNNIYYNWEGINISQSYNIKINNNNVLYNSNSGVIVWSSSSNNEIINNNIIGNKDGISVNFSQNIRLFNNQIYSNQSNGIRIFKADNCTAKNNDLDYNLINGIYFTNVNNSGITNNNIFHSSNGVLFTGISKTNTIFNNEIATNSGFGILFNGDDVENNLIMSNSIFSNGKISGQGGINIIDSDYNFIYTNNIFLNYARGINLSSSSISNKIIGNNIFSNIVYGISTGGNTVVIGNKMLYNRRQISVSGSFNQVYNNLVTHGINGILLMWGNNVVNNNNVYTNSSTGIISFGVAAGKNVIISNNLIGNRYAVYINNPGNIDIKENNIYKSSMYGIYISNSTNINIQNNKILYNSVKGGIIITNSKVRIELNLIASNKTGIYLDNGSVITNNKNNIYDNTDFNFFNSSGSYINITNNWWGSTVASVIASKISNNGGYSNFTPYRLFNRFSIVEGADTTPVSVITFFTAVSGNTNIDLTWNQATNADFTKYNIYRSVESGTTNLTGSNVVWTITSNAVTNFIDKPGVGTWYYHITVLDDPSGTVYTNECWYSKEVSGTLVPGYIKLTKLTNLPSTNIKENSTNISVMALRIEDKFNSSLDFIRLGNAGTMSNMRDIKSVKLWYDTDSSKDHSPGDLFITNGIWTNLKWIFYGPVISGTNFIFTLDNSATPYTNTTFQGFVTAGDIHASTGATNTNSVTNTGIITNIVSHLLSFTEFTLPAYIVTRSAVNCPVLSFYYYDNYGHPLSLLNITNLGTMNNMQDISKIKIFYDTGILGIVDGESSAGELYYNTAYGKWTNNSIISNSRRILVAADISTNPAVGRTFQAAIISTNDVNCMNNKKITSLITNDNAITIDNIKPIFNPVNSISNFNYLTVDLSWPAANDSVDFGSNPIVYNIYTAKNLIGFNFNKTNYSVTNSTSIAINDLQEGMNYIVILAFDNMRNVSTNTNYQTTEIDRYKDDLGYVRVYPVPCFRNQILKIDKLTQTAKIKIFSITGILVIEKEINNYQGIPVEINLADHNIASGVYIMVISNNKNKPIYKKFVYFKGER